MDEIKKEMAKLAEKLAENETRIMKMEITIHGTEGRGGLYEKVDTMNNSLKSLQKSYWIGIGALMIIQVVILPLIFKYLI